MSELQFFEAHLDKLSMMILCEPVKFPKECDKG